MPYLIQLWMMECCFWERREVRDDSETVQIEITVIQLLLGLKSRDVKPF